MRLFCWYCKKSVSSELGDDAVFRAIAICPECIENDVVQDMPRSLTTHEAVATHTCPSCGGSGIYEGYISQPHKCVACDGTGQV